jgi:hypothetical protein
MEPITHLDLATHYEGCLDLARQAIGAGGGEEGVEELSDKHIFLLQGAWGMEGGKGVIQ